MSTLARLDKEHSGVMTDEGRSVRERRTALGMSQDDLAKEAGVNRDTVGAIEKGLGFRRSSLTKLEEALTRIEEEVGIDSPPAAAKEEPRLVEFDVSGEGGFHIVVRGPVEDADALKRQVVDIVLAMRKAEKDDPEAGR